MNIEEIFNAMPENIQQELIRLLQKEEQKKMDKVVRERYRADIVHEANIIGRRCQSCGLFVIKSFNEEYTKEDMEETA